MGMPLLGPRVDSRLAGGYIVPPSVLEIIVADHCNLVCRQCNHGSPGVAKWLADPRAVGRDLAILARSYHPPMLKLIGGEPLLHPDLAGLIETVRGAGLSDKVELVTNGTLLGRMPDRVWRLIDKLAVSVYAGTEVEAMLPALREKARAFGVELVAAAFPQFRDTLSSLANEDAALVRRVHAACKLANVWAIHGLYRGRIYKCPQSMYAPRLARRPIEDGLVIEDAPGFQQRLLAFLNGREPLGSCSHCVGTVGRKDQHRFLDRDAWIADLARPPAEMIDQDLLARSLDELSPADDCAQPLP